MSYRLLIEPLAKADIVAARDWYFSQQVGLDVEFRDQLDEVLQRIQSNPLAFAKTYRDVRQAVLKRFPYVVSFVVRDDAVRVIAILHGHRDPALWKERSE
ncbi:MAG: type II toxin-antitoxin system RelE/ParE family toxin [Aureliella sp.]